MIIAVPTKEGDLDSAISNAFSRSKYFIIYYGADDTYEVIENPEEEIAGPGATERIINKNVDLVIARDIGRYTRNALMERGIKVIAGARGSCWDEILRHLE